MDKVALLKKVTDMVDISGAQTVGAVIPMITEAGITSGIHLGQPQAFFDEDDDRIVDWLLGQYLSVIENEAWFAVNSLINQSNTWVKKLEAKKKC